MKTKTFKNYLGIFIIVLILFNAMMLVACGGDDEKNTIKVSSKKALIEVVETADKNKIIKLANNISCDLVIAKGAIITLDLNGYKLSNETNHTITNNGTLTIKDTGEHGKVDNITHGKASILNNVGGVVVLNGGTYLRSKETGEDKNTSGRNSFYTIQNFGELTINSRVEVENDGHYSSMITNGWYDGTKNTTETEAKLIINGGSFVGGLNTIKNDDWGVTTIKGGEFKNFTQACVFNVNKLTISNGYIDGSQAEQAIYTRKYDDKMDLGKTVITNAKIKGALTVATNGTYTISGGLFTVAIPNAYLLEGYICQSNTGEYSYKVVLE